MRGRLPPMEPHESKPADPTARPPSSAPPSATAPSPLGAPQGAAVEGRADPSVEDTALLDDGEIDGPAYTMGARFGRYTLLEELGRGGMGVVYRAHDPDLRRPVALKLLRVRARHKAGGGEGLARDVERLVREAQALARLSHPNVVTVHDIGTVDSTVFVAMELVAGTTLRRWLAQDPERSWRAVVDVFLAAGEGLAAAHAAGIVHRDFKPDNVIVGDDGRVRVLDFGLARADQDGPDELGRSSASLHGSQGSSGPPSGGRPRAAEATAARRGEPAVTVAGVSEPPLRAEAPASAGAPAPATPSARTLGASSLDVPLTRAGVLMGTVGYMAPEQFVGQVANARTDQYSFAVALYEALVGRRPYRSAKERITRSDRDDPFRKVPGDRTVPRHVRAALRRGLAVHPAERYASMHELLAQLRKDPLQRARRWAPLALAALATGAAFLWARRTADARLAMCRGSDERLASVWSAETKAAVARAFQASGLAYAPAAAAKVVATLDGYGARWTEARRDACEATRVRGEQTESVMELRMACLDRRLVDLRAQVGVLTSADATVVEKAPLAVRQLVPVDVCADVEALRAAVPLPVEPERRAAAGDVVAALGRARALLNAGKVADSEAAAHEALDKVRVLGFRPLEAEALSAAGQAARHLGKYDAAVEKLEDAARAAIAGRRDDTLVEAYNELVWVLGQGQRKFPEAHRAERDAEAALERLSFPEGPRIDLLANSSGLLFTERKYEEARAKAADAASRAEKLYEGSDPRVGAKLITLGNALGMLGRLDEAKAVFTRAVDVLRAAYGEEHPRVASALNNLGTVASRKEDWRGALEFYRAARDIWIRTLGPEHPFVATVRFNIGVTDMSLGEHTDGEAELLLARQLYATNAGASSIEVAITDNALGDLYRSAKRYDDAYRVYERALRLAEAVGDPLVVANARFGRTKVLHSLEKYADEARELEALLPTVETNANEGPRRLEAERALAEAYFALGRLDAALPHARSAYDTALATKLETRWRVPLAVTYVRVGSHVPSEHTRVLRVADEIVALGPEADQAIAGVTTELAQWRDKGGKPMPVHNEGPVGKRLP